MTAYTMDQEAAKTEPTPPSDYPPDQASPTIASVPESTSEMPPQRRAPEPKPDDNPTDLVSMLKPIPKKANVKLAPAPLFNGSNSIISKESTPNPIDAK
jgi:hypothetical protein